jgi:hypothetical protein
MTKAFRNLSYVPAIIYYLNKNNIKYNINSISDDLKNNIGSYNINNIVLQHCKNGPYDHFFSLGHLETRMESGEDEFGIITINVFLSKIIESYRQSVINDILN